TTTKMTMSRRKNTLSIAAGSTAHPSLVCTLHRKNGLTSSLFLLKSVPMNPPSSPTLFRETANDDFPSFHPDNAHRCSRFHKLAVGHRVEPFIPDLNDARRAQGGDGFAHPAHRKGRRLLLHRFPEQPVFFRLFDGGAEDEALPCPR